MTVNCVLGTSIASVLDLVTVITELQVCRRKFLLLGDTCSGIMINV